jgi:DNA helicase HerA-like ATPase
MDNRDKFSAAIADGYTTKGDSITLGAAMLDGEPITEATVRIPLKTLNRHGLIAGATGTGKTKTIQVLSEQLSSLGIPVLMMDIKGDFSGVAKPGDEKPFIAERQQKIGLPWKSSSFPVELMTLSEQNGVRLARNGFRIWTGPILTDSQPQRYTGRRRVGHLQIL